MPRLLVIRRNNLGDAVCVLPWLQGLREANPELLIDVITSPYASVIFKRSSVIREVVSIPEVYLGTALGVLLHPALRWLKSQQPYDYVVNAGGFSDKASILAYLAPGKKKIGTVSGKGKFIDKVWDVPVLPVRDGRHQVMKIAYVGEQGGVGVNDLPPPVLFKNNDLNTNRIALCPLVNRLASRWKDKHWLGLEAELLQQGLPVVWLGMRPDKGRGDLIAPRSTDEFLDEVSKSGLVICSEGGTSHVAPAFGVPTIVLSGVLIRDTWCPWSALAVVLEQEGNVDGIAINDVLRQVESWLSLGRFVEIEGAYLNRWVMGGSNHV